MFYSARCSLIKTGGKKMPTTEEKVRQIISDQLGKDPKDLKLEASFVDNLGADSLDTVEIVMALEEEFGLEIPDVDGHKIATVGEAVAYIKSKKGET